jgi:amino acid adenylation domain-containing protein
MLVSDVAVGGLNAFAQFLESRPLNASTEERARYWRTRLDGAPPVSTLVPRTAQSSQRTHAGRQLIHGLDPAAVAAIRTLADRYRTTVFVVGLTAHATLLAGLASQSEVCVSISTENRPPDFLGALGYFSNTVPVRIALDLSEDFGQCLARVARVLEQDIANSDLDFPDILGASAVEQLDSYFPLVQTEFNLVEEPGAVVHQDGAIIEVLTIPGQGSKLDLTVSLILASSGWSLLAEYAHPRFEETDCQWFCRSLCALLESAAACPGVPSGALGLLSATDRVELTPLVAPARSFSLPEAPFHRLVEAVVQTAAERTALQFCGSEMSYRELWERAGQLAVRLRALQVGPGSMVGICVGRGFGYPVCALAVMRAGGAFCPLEPDYGPALLGQMCRLAGLTVVLTDDSTQQLMGAVLPDGVLLDWAGPGGGWNAAAAADGAADELADPVVDPDMPVYGMFTSGSTGLPKLALVHHRGAINHILSKIEDMGIGDDFVFLQNAPVSSDISFWQYVGPLLTGGRVVIQRNLRDLEETARLMASSQITLVEAVPVVVQEFLRLIAERPDLAAAIKTAGQVRYLMFTGDRLLPTQVRDWYDQFPDIRVLNAFGPTEASDDVIQAHIPPDAGLAGTVPLGRVLPGIEVRILSPWFDQVPPGGLGEICVSGVAVGGGYQGDPRRTARSFVPDPFSSVPGRRMYRMGDVGRMLPEGVFHFHGRNDHQTKVNGVRVELGAVEAAALDCAGVSMAACVAFPSQDGSTQLALFYQPANPSDQSLHSALGQALEERLPPAVWPYVRQALDRLPLTANGKIDRKVLTARAAGGDVHDVAETAGDPKLEAAVLDIVRDVLRNRSIEAEDLLVRCGLNSLSAARIAARLGEASSRGAMPGPSCPYDVPLRTVLAQRTVRRLTNHILTLGPPRSAGIDAPASSRPGFPPPSQTDAITAPLEPGDCIAPNPYQMSFLMPDLLEGLTHSSRYTTGFALLVEGIPDLADKVHELRDALVARHPWLSVRLEGTATGAPLFRLGAGCIPVERLAEDSADRATIIQNVERVFEAPFEIEGEFLVRLAVVGRAGSLQALAVCAYHAVIDGWGIAWLRREVVEDLWTLADGLPLQTDRRSPVFPPAADAVADPGLEAYWLELFASCPAPSQFLPDRFEESAGQVLRASLQLDRVACERVRSICEREAATSFCVAVAASALALASDTGDTVISLGIAFANRLTSRDERDLACRVNTVPVVVDVSQPDLTLATAQVARQLLSGGHALSVPLEQIQARLPLIDRAGTGALFSVLVTMNNIEDTANLAAFVSNRNEELSVKIEEYETQHTPLVYPVIIDFVQLPEDGVEVRLELDSAHYSRDRANEILDLIQNVIVDRVGEALQ